VSGGFVDIAEASNGALSSSVREVLGQLEDLRTLNQALGGLIPTQDELPELAKDERLDVVVDEPRQVFAVGLNYRTHAHEMGLANPTAPMIFTKFPSCLAGQHAQVPRVSDTTDWEAEMVIVIGRGGRAISEADALSAVAGFCVGQDISDRGLQMAGNPAQFSLGKSWQNFGPVGPWITTTDEIASADDLAIQCSISDTLFQDSRTSDMVFSVSEVVSYLSQRVELFPGDLIFTGSPHGVGQGLKPPRFLAVGDTIATTIEGLGTLYCDVVDPAVL
jgi:2-keto-4-pentenoate hydratase/2-oxohepta-3-ene-1,7-dioic acid hydratase in catechol pathway